MSDSWYRGQFILYFIYLTTHNFQTVLFKGEVDMVYICIECCQNMREAFVKCRKIF